MDTNQAFILGDLNRHKEKKVFDWDEAARRIKESGCVEAEAGLESDWEWTGGVIFLGGKPVDRHDTYTYLASVWATPILMINGESFDCFKMQSETDNWDSDTFWPESALAILKGVQS